MPSYISTISPIYLPYISPISPLYLPYISPISPLATEVPPTLRVDLLLTRAGPGRAELHTLELSEAGCSLLGWRGGPAQVMGAVSPLYPRCISAISPLYLPYISPMAAQVMGALLDA